MSRYGDDIRRIAGVDDIKAKLKDIEDRVEIAGKRGIGYFTTSGGVNGVTGAPAETKAPANLVIGQNAVADAATTSALAAATAGEALSSSAMGAGPLGGFSATISTSSDQNVKGSLDGVQDATDLFDKTNTFGNYANDIIGAQLNGLTGFTDCGSGKDISQVRMDGRYIPPVPYSNSSIPSWTEATTPPLLNGWTSGVQYTDTGLFYNSGQIFNSYGGAVSYIVGYYNDVQPTRAPWTVSGVSSSGVKLTDKDGTQTGNIVLISVSCTPGTATCPAAQPYAGYWPVLDTFQVTADKTTGLFKSSQYDSIAPTEFKDGKSSMDLCFGGDRFARIENNNIGGKNIYETSSQGGAAVGIVRVYDSQNRLVAFTDTAGLLNYRT